VLYEGTGSLLVSGSPNGPLLASHNVSVSTCWFRKPNNDEPPDVMSPFSVLAIGDTCTLDDLSAGRRLQPVPGTTCALDFGDGKHAVRLTDFSRRYAFAGRIIDTSHIDIEMGGDDTTTGRHVLYRFSGSAQMATTEPNCAELVAKHAGRVPNA